MSKGLSQGRSSGCSGGLLEEDVHSECEPELDVLQSLSPLPHNPGCLAAGGALRGRKWRDHQEPQGRTKQTPLYSPVWLDTAQDLPVRALSAGASCMRPLYCWLLLSHHQHHRFDFMRMNLWFYLHSLIHIWCLECCLAHIKHSIIIKKKSRNKWVSERLSVRKRGTASTRKQIPPSLAAQSWVRGETMP